MMYVENPKESKNKPKLNKQKKLLKLLSSANLKHTRSTHQKQSHFHTLTTDMWNNLKKNTKKSFTISAKQIKCLGINLTEHV